MHKRRLFNVVLCAAGLFVLLRAAVRDAEAQSAVVTGKVVGRGGDALGGAIVVIDQLSVAAATTVAGAYTLTVPAQWTKGQTVTLRARDGGGGRKSTRLNSSHLVISYAVFCFEKKNTERI